MENSVEHYLQIFRNLEKTKLQELSQQTVPGSSANIAIAQLLSEIANKEKEKFLKEERDIKERHHLESIGSANKTRWVAIISVIATIIIAIITLTSRKDQSAAPATGNTMPLATPTITPSSSPNP